MNAPAQNDTHWLTVPATISGVLRPYQIEHLGKAADALHRGVRRILVQAPTGSGKTHLIAAATQAASSAGLRVLILATRTRLVKQVHERLESFGVDHGVMAAAFPELRWHAATVQVCSVDTLYRRCLVDRRAPLPSADVVIFDEAHLALGSSRLALLEQYPNAWLLGFTATPAKVSGRSLGNQFDELICGPTVRELIELGMLVRPRIFNKPVVSADELDAVSRDSKTNDFTTTGIGGLMSRPKLVGDVVQNWLKIANGKRTLCFAVNKGHGEQLVIEFRQAGIAAELLTDQTPEDEREAAIARLESGETLILVSCFLLSYGVDIPSVEAVILARPTRSLVLYLQTVGRGLRPAPGKDHCLIIDHGRCVETLGLPHEDFGWSLEAGSNVSRSAIDSRTRAQWVEKTRECPECSHLWLVSEEGPACRACGWVPTPKAKPVRTEAAELGEMDSAQEVASPHSLQVRQFFSEALGYYAQRWPDRWRDTPNKGRGFAWAKTRERFGWDESVRIPSAFWTEWPSAPSKPTSGWLLSRAIAYGRSRAASYA